MVAWCVVRLIRRNDARYCENSKDERRNDNNKSTIDDAEGDIRLWTLRWRPMMGRLTIDQKRTHPYENSKDMALNVIVYVHNRIR